jgi:hypothetical protein
MIALDAVLAVARSTWPVALMAAAWMHGCSAGRAGAERDAQQAELARQQAIAEVRSEEQRLVARVRAQYAAQRREIEVRHAEASARLRNALQRPISAAPGQPLADLLLPADVVDGLRDAGRDPAP